MIDRKFLIICEFRATICDVYEIALLARGLEEEEQQQHNHQGIFQIVVCFLYALIDLTQRKFIGSILRQLQTRHVNS